MSLIGELKRRNVLRVGAAYVVASWLLLQVIDVVGPILRLPDTVARYVLFVLVVGLLPALVFAWVYEWTPQGVRRESELPATDRARGGRKLDRVIMVTLALAVALLLFDRFRTAENETGQPTETRIQELEPPASSGSGSVAPLSKSVAVLPFVPMSNGPDDDYFADGLTEEIINALGQAPDLLVTARTSAFHFRDSALTIGEIARELGVANVVEGSVRRAGDQLRISAKLVRAADGFQLWSETFDRVGGNDFGVQANIAEKVAEALDILLDDGLRQRMQTVRTRNIEAFIAFQKGIELYERAHKEANQISLLRQANVHFEQASELEPGLYAAYEYHTDLYAHILLSQANGELDGDITAADIEFAPTALREDLDRAIRSSRTPSERANADFGKALFMGPWRGLGLLAKKAAAPPGCETGVWLQLLGAMPGETDDILAAFDRMATCDPLRARSSLHQVGLTLWQGRANEAISLARSAMERSDHPQLVRHLALALAYTGQAAEAEAVLRHRLLAEDRRLQALGMLAAILGDAEAAAKYQREYLGLVGGDDRATLVFEALRGNRNEANRIAGGIDARPFGHVVLLDSIFECLCGAPFDLEATPVFASMLAESGLDWPPLAPYDLPLKDW